MNPPAAIQAHPGALDDLPTLLREAGFVRVMIFRGRHSFSLSGAAGRLAGLGGTGGAGEHVVPPGSPTAESIIQAAQQVRRHQPQAVLAVGGGSVIDTAKSARWLAGDPDLGVAGYFPSARRRGDIAAEPVCIAVPTTAGTGSEVTPFAVFHHRGAKHSLDHPGLRPDYAIVDPTLTASLPAYETACTGLDAACQCIEALWAPSATTASNAAARAGLALIGRWFYTAIHRPIPEAREAMAQAALQSGLAIACTRTTAAHALSYALTADHGLPHGHAVALCMGPVFDLHATAGGPEGARLAAMQEEVAARLEIGGSGTFRQRWEAKLAAWGVAPTLAAAGVPASAVRGLVGRINRERLANHPIPLDLEALGAALWAPLLLESGLP